jgi:hypothetical protein
MVKLGGPPAQHEATSAVNTKILFWYINIIRMSALIASDTLPEDQFWTQHKG